MTWLPWRVGHTVNYVPARLRPDWPPLVFGDFTAVFSEVSSLKPWTHNQQMLRRHIMVVLSRFSVPWSPLFSLTGEKICARFGEDFFFKMHHDCDTLYPSGAVCFFSLNNRCPLSLCLRFYMAAFTENCCWTVFLFFMLIDWRHYVFGLSVRGCVRACVRPSVRSVSTIPSSGFY